MPDNNITRWFLNLLQLSESLKKLFQMIHNQAPAPEILNQKIFSEMKARHMKFDKIPWVIVGSPQVKNP